MKAKTLYSTSLALIIFLIAPSFMSIETSRVSENKIQKGEINFQLSDTDTVFAFFEYKIRDGMEDAFKAGYERDLDWHKSQNDDWSWIGWYVSNGERRNRFIDATPNHAWSDFDTWKVNGTLNAQLNKIHWANYVENPTGGYKVLLPYYSNSSTNWFKSKSLQVHTIEIDIAKEKVFLDFLNEYKGFLKSYLKGTHFVWMETASGGYINEYQLFVCLEKKEQMNSVAKIFNSTEMPSDIWKIYSTSVTSNMCEVWDYEPTMSLYPPTSN